MRSNKRARPTLVHQSSLHDGAGPIPSMQHFRALTTPSWHSRGALVHAEQQRASEDHDPYLFALERNKKNEFPSKTPPVTWKTPIQQQVARAFRFEEDWNDSLLYNICHIFVCHQCKETGLFLAEHPRYCRRCVLAGERYEPAPGELCLKGCNEHALEPTPFLKLAPGCCEDCYGYAQCDNPDCDESGNQVAYLNYLAEAVMDPDDLEDEPDEQRACLCSECLSNHPELYQHMAPGEEDPEPFCGCSYCQLAGEEEETGRPLKRTKKNPV